MLQSLRHPIFLGEILEESPIESSAPCRIDCGGTLDIKALALPLQGLNPATVNLAIDMRTYVRLKAYKANRIRVSSAGFTSEEYGLNQAPFDTPLGYFFAIASFFRVHGVQITIQSESPIRSALGGSSVAGVAVISALSKALEKAGQKRLTKKETALLAYNLEDGVGVSFCGLQDHAAACYGGVNKWRWGYHPVEHQFQRIPLVDQTAYEELSSHLLIAYSGESHNSVEINLKWVNEFLKGKYRDKWIESIQYVNDFAHAIKYRDWQAAISALRSELNIRRIITPEAISAKTSELLAVADEAGCGARFAGAGGGGCCWAIGEPQDIERLKDNWQQILNESEQGRLLNNKIAIHGVI